jgi:SAM-dependent methyltransferase
MVGDRERQSLPFELRRPQVEKLYAELPYLEAYRRHSRLRVEHDPQAAVGGLWDVLGPLQRDYLIRNGLIPSHRLLDIGCGSLRAGRLLIPYLDVGHYHGFDMVPEMIDAGRALIEHEGLSDKRPHLAVNGDGNLRLDMLPAATFDFLLAQSVFTHLPPEAIEECFAHVGRVMRPAAKFFFTFDDAAHFIRRGSIWPYPYSFFEALAERYGFCVELRSDYDHPRGQTMVLAQSAS